MVPAATQEEGSGMKRIAIFACVALCAVSCAPAQAQCGRTSQFGLGFYRSRMDTSEVMDAPSISRYRPRYAVRESDYEREEREDLEFRFRRQSQSRQAFPRPSAYSRRYVEE